MTLYNIYIYYINTWNPGWRGQCTCQLLVIVSYFGVCWGKGKESEPSLSWALENSDDFFFFLFFTNLINGNRKKKVGI